MKNAAIGVMALALQDLQRLVKTVVRGVVGDVRWRPPRWLQTAQQAWRAAEAGRRAQAAYAWAERHPLHSGAAILLLIALWAAASYGYRWYQARPKPIEVMAKSSAPALGNYEAETFIISPVRIAFDHPAIALPWVGKQLPPPSEAQLATIDPPLEGVWRAEDDRHVSFTPKEDWPIGAQFQVKFAREFFAGHVNVKGDPPKFTTPDFRAELQEAIYYQDPKEAGLKKIVVTLKFTHPVDNTLLESRIVFRDEQKRGLLGLGNAKLNHSVTYDKKKLYAYVHSDPVKLSEDGGSVEFELGAGVRAQSGGNATDRAHKRRVAIPSLSSLRFDNANLFVADADTPEPKLVMALHASDPVAPRQVAANLEAWVLPTYHPDTPKDQRTEPHRWGGAGEIGADVFKQSKPVKLLANEGEREHVVNPTFKAALAPGDYLYVRVKPGVKSFGGLVNLKASEFVIAAPAFPKRLKLAGEGSVLALSGEKKMGLLSRGIKSAKIEIARVRADQAHILISQNGGTLTQPNFDGTRLGLADLAEYFTEIKPLATEGHATLTHAIDLKPYLEGAGGRKGLFVISVSEHKPKSDKAQPPSQVQENAEEQAPGEGEGEGEGNDNSAPPQQDDAGPVFDRRFILVTDLGIIAKRSVDGTQDIFVASIASGEAIAGATVQVIGRNGLAVLGATTDAKGRATLPTLKGFERERMPLLYLVQKGGDLSVLPINRFNRNLDFSRFDIWGVANNAEQGKLSAYLFSDRGMYRPGEEMRFGLIVKPQNWNVKKSALPLAVVLTDPRGVVVRRDNVTFTPDGFEAFTHRTREESPTGNYTLAIYLPGPGGDLSKDELLGTTTVKVREFLPDRLKISTKFSRESDGWINPEDLKALVKVENLFGAPAQQRRVTARMSLSPTVPYFAAFPEFRFHDPDKAKVGTAEDLPEAQTNDQGEAEINLNIERFAQSTYRLHVVAQGFEAEGGRGVAAERTLLVSPAKHLIGVKSGDLNYITKGAKRKVDLIAIGPNLKAAAADKLKIALFERRYVSVLTQQRNGTYRYESQRRDVRLSEAALKLDARVTPFTLATKEPGDFFYVIEDDSGREMNRIAYMVAGDANLTRPLERNNELQVKLNKKDYKAGETIEIAIRAPYTGYGLITIERERVHEALWFKTSTTASVQKIRVPEGMEGNGYVNIAFMRDLGSKEIFMNPLSYAAMPFTINLAERALELKLEAPGLVKPGESATFKLSANRSARAVVFAVDEGILQVAGYARPDPLAHFFAKRALDVRTAQILDLLLPEFKLWMAQAAAGGDGTGGFGKHLNPFKKKRDEPAAYWSGIVEVDAKGTELSYVVPAHFNGRLKVFAVAVNEAQVGTAEAATVARGDFILTPNAPVAVLPGDEFEVSVGIANQLKGSGKDAAIDIALAASKELEVLDARTQTLKVREGGEGVILLRVKAREKLGEGTLTFTATGAGGKATAKAAISVRPATPLRTEIAVGRVDKGDKDIAMTRRLYDERAERALTFSGSPLALAAGLSTYLRGYPYGCTEQIVSKTMPELVLAPNQALTKDHVAKTIATLRTRQTQEGGFGLYQPGGEPAEFASLYAVHFLLEARARGHAVPPDMLKFANNWLTRFAASKGSSLSDERNRAYAIYLVTLQETQSASLIAGITDRLNANHRGWQGDLTAAYLASSLKLLKDDSAADKLMAQVGLAHKDWFRGYAYYDGMVRDAVILDLTARHFPSRLKVTAPKALETLVSALSNESYMSLSAAYGVLGLERYAKVAGSTGDVKLAASTKVDAKAGTPLQTLSLDAQGKARFGGDVALLKLTSIGELPGFFTVSTSGYDKAVATQSLAKGIEIQRELLDAQGRPVKQIKQGDTITVKIIGRSLEGTRPHIAIADLIPGGFDLVIDSASQASIPTPARALQSQGATTVAAQSAMVTDFVDRRDDRVLIYATLDSAVREFRYQIRAVSVGKFVLPPAFGEAMYSRGVFGQSQTGSIEVVK